MGIDASIEHAEGLTEQEGTLSISRPGIVGKIITLLQ